eukprot:TRINITY_DN2081_c0_g1_i1.p1 TRINITY_DN2081_c0_g1~~TRINITY_DN2081_c0_g1_i1.p1  ORF type:complete len:205 (-),score=85.60 TRINITY_DN2081_c0_g1_i1:1058-1672(-)
MGHGNSKTRLQSKDLEKLVEALALTTHFAPEEIISLYEHFSKISGSETRDGVIDQSEFKKALGIENESLCGRLFQQFDGNNDGSITFQEFVCSLSVLSEKGTLDEKIRFSFGLYANRENVITQNGLLEMLEVSMVDTGFIQLSEEEMVELVQQTFVQVDEDGDGVISFAEYEAMVRRNPSIVEFLTIRVLADDDDDDDEDDDSY